MPTYVYETIPQSTEEAPRRFEVRQSMKDAPLTHHPDNGTPVRRVIMGGTGIMGVGASAAPRAVAAVDVEPVVGAIDSMFLLKV